MRRLPGAGRQLLLGRLRAVPAATRRRSTRAPYTIKNVEGLRVGVIGLANLSSLNSIVEGGNSLQVTPLEQNEAIRALRRAAPAGGRPDRGGQPRRPHRGPGAHAGLRGLLRVRAAPSPTSNRANDPWKILEWFGPEDVDPKSVVRVWIPGVSGVDVILGGHLHVVLNPPQPLTDPAGRKVVLSHGGAFAKYVVRLDAGGADARQGPAPPTAPRSSATTTGSSPSTRSGATTRCTRTTSAKFWNPGEFAAGPEGARRRIEACCHQRGPRHHPAAAAVHPRSRRRSCTSPRIFSYAPREHRAPQQLDRRRLAAGQHGRRLDAQAPGASRRRWRSPTRSAFATTSTPGPLTQEAMFNVFPFENTINIMYLSGVEMQEMFDFVTERSAERGCVSQAQISGARFTMDCAQVQLNDLRISCDPKNERRRRHCLERSHRDGRAPWQCLEDATTGDGPLLGAPRRRTSRSTASRSTPTTPTASRSTTTSPRAARASWCSSATPPASRPASPCATRSSATCRTSAPATTSSTGKTDRSATSSASTGQACGNRSSNGQWIVDDQIVGYCKTAKAFHDELQAGTSRRLLLPRRLRRAPRNVAAAPPTPRRKTGCAPATAAARRARRWAAAAAATRWPAHPICGTVTRRCATFCVNPTGVARGARGGRRPHRPEGQVMSARFRWSALLALAGCYCDDRPPPPRRRRQLLPRSQVKGVYQVPAEHAPARPLDVVTTCASRYGGQGKVPGGRARHAGLPLRQSPRRGGDRLRRHRARRERPPAHDLHRAGLLPRRPGRPLRRLPARWAQADRRRGAAAPCAPCTSTARCACGWTTRRPSPIYADGGAGRHAGALPRASQPTAATPPGLSPTVFFDDPTLRALQIPDGFDNRSSPLVGEFVTVGQEPRVRRAAARRAAPTIPARDGQPAAMVVTGSTPSGFFVSDVTACRLQEWTTDATGAAAGAHAGAAREVPGHRSPHGGDRPIRGRGRRRPSCEVSETGAAPRRPTARATCRAPSAHVHLQLQLPRRALRRATCSGPSRARCRSSPPPPR